MYKTLVCTLFGGKCSADAEAAAKYGCKFAKLVTDEKLTAEQTYNTDVTALFWPCMLRQTLASETQEVPIGYKEANERVTVLGCSNAVETQVYL